jgi:outer membrane protein assembly factor BamB
VGLAPDRIVVTDPDGIVWALDKNTGTAMWSQPAMARRGLTAPAIQGDYAVVGDFDGYLHWLKLDTGELAARVRTGRDAVRATPTVVDGILVVEDTDGGLNAYRVGQ